MVGEWLLKEYDQALGITEDDEIDEAVKAATVKRLPTSDEDTTHGFRLLDGINFVADLLRISRIRLSKWIAHYLLHGELMPLNVRKSPPLLDHTSKVSKAHILEAMSLLRDRNSKGLQTNYTLVVTHLMGEERINPYLDLDNCPAVRHLQRIKEFRCRGVSRLDDGTELIHDPACALYGKYTVDPNDPLYGEHIPDFYNWDWEPVSVGAEKDDMDDMEGSCRNMILEHDNAPYCHGVEVQLSSYSREKCANLLRKLDIQRVLILRPDMSIIVKTPLADNIPWDTATFKVTAAEIKSATYDAVLLRKPSLLKPGYMSLCEKYKIIVTFTCPYTSNLCCIESKWQIAKSELANPHNQKSGRSCAEVVIIMRKKWYDVLPDRGSGPKDPLDMIFVRHCHRLMNEELVQLRTSYPEVFPLIGNVTDFSNSIDCSELMFGAQAVNYKRMAGGPTCERDWNELKERAGVLQSRLGDVTQGDDVDGDPLNLPELTAYEQAAAFGDID